MEKIDELISIGCLAAPRPPQEQIFREISAMGGNFQKDFIFHALYFSARGFRVDEIPQEIKDKACQQQIETYAQWKEMKAREEENTQLNESSDSATLESSTDVC